VVGLLIVALALLVVALATRRGDGGPPRSTEPASAAKTRVA
jgi:hypothetical protein